MNVMEKEISRRSRKAKRKKYRESFTKWFAYILFIPIFPFILVWRGIGKLWDYAFKYDINRAKVMIDKYFVRVAEFDEGKAWYNTEWFPWVWVITKNPIDRTFLKRYRSNIHWLIVKGEYIPKGWKRIPYTDPEWLAFALEKEQ